MGSDDVRLPAPQLPGAAADVRLGVALPQGGPVRGRQLPQHILPCFSP